MNDHTIFPHIIWSNPRYRFVREIGAGWGGTLSLAQDTLQDQRSVAIKQINLQRSLPGEAIQLADLDHPGIPALYEVFYEPPYWYIVREFIDGSTLDEYVKDVPLSVGQVLELGMQLCDILQHFHEQDPPLVHRDIKPKNILISPGDKLTLIDFGRTTRLPVQDNSYTGPGPYAPPEMGKADQPLATTSDVYEIGAVLRELLQQVQEVPLLLIDLTTHMTHPERACRPEVHEVKRVLEGLGTHDDIYEIVMEGRKV